MTSYQTHIRKDGDWYEVWAYVKLGNHTLSNIETRIETKDQNLEPALKTLNKRISQKTQTAI